MSARALRWPPRRRPAGALAGLTALVLFALLLPAGAIASLRLEKNSVEVSATESGGSPDAQAGSPPYQLATKFAIKIEHRGTYTLTSGDPKDVRVELPPGLVGNPEALPRCTVDIERATHGCPGDTVVGYAVSAVTANKQETGYGVSPVYNLQPPPGLPAEFGFVAHEAAAVFLRPTLRAGGDYGITVTTPDLPQVAEVSYAKVVIWGVPADPSHDTLRGDCISDETLLADHEPESVGSCPSGLPLRPFLTEPTSCGAPGAATLSIDSWQEPGLFLTETLPWPQLTGCAALPFSPTLSLTPSTPKADTPAAVDVDLHVPQHEGCEAGPPVSCEAAEAHLKNTRVTLPAGLRVNPSLANGLAACSEAQVGYEGLREGIQRFSPDPAECPEASKLGTVEVDTPLLEEHPGEHPLPGAVYLAKPFDNPFDSLQALYIAVYDPQTGVVVKLPGRVEAGGEEGAPAGLAPGQLRASFTESPQLPFEDFKLDFFGGPRAALRTPSTCGRYATASVLTPWSSPAAPAAEPPSEFSVSEAPGGGACAPSEAQQPNQPGFEAGTLSTQAGAFSPFVLKLSRADGSQEIKGLDVTLPPGLIGKLAGVGECSEAQIAQAQARSKPGLGAAEQASPSCPAASELGTVAVAAGAGTEPFHAAGHAYLAGPYKGAPLSMVIITPALAGPFDLGAVVVRAALYVNPETAQITAKSDPIPTILDGVPLDLRSVVVDISRNQFTLNPTSCDSMAIGGTALAVSQAALTSPFQVGGCPALPFGPKLALKLKGSTKRSGTPALTATLTAAPGEANIAFAQVTLPHSEFLDQAHIGTVCTRVQFAEGGGNGEKCPAASIYGHATATTPLLEAPLSGNVYLRSSSHQLPDLVVALHGQIDVVLDGRVDSVHGGIRNSFEVVPDAPVSKFTLQMQGGKKGLLENSTNLCARKNRATVDLTGQNGKVHDTTPVLATSCQGKGKRHHKRAAG